MTEKRPLKVFLCHAHADRDRVRALYTRLTKEKLIPGQDWEFAKLCVIPPLFRYQVFAYNSFVVGSC